MPGKEARTALGCGLGVVRFTIGPALHMADPDHPDLSGDGLHVAQAPVCPLCGSAHFVVGRSHYFLRGRLPVTNKALRELLQRADRFDYVVDGDRLDVEASAPLLESFVGSLHGAQRESTNAQIGHLTWEGLSHQARLEAQLVAALTGVRGFRRRAIIRLLRTSDERTDALVRFLERSISDKDRQNQVKTLRELRVMWRYEGLARSQIVVLSLIRILQITWPFLAWAGAVALAIAGFLRAHYGFSLLLLLALLGATGHAVFLEAVWQQCRRWKRKAIGFIALGSGRATGHPIPSGGKA